MNFKRILLSFLAIGSLTIMSFELPKKIQKKVKKEIVAVFEVEDFSLIAMPIADELNEKLTSKVSDESFFRIISNEKLVGYAYVDRAPSKTAEFDYLVLFDKDLIIAKAKVLIYREEYGGEIGSKRWLKQFIGKTSKDNLQQDKDVVAISGATISVRSMTKAVNQLLQNVSLLHENKFFD